MQIFYNLQLIYLLQIQWIINANPIVEAKLKNIQEINYCQNKTDSEIIDLFPFDVHPNPMLPKPSMTYALLDTNYRINYIQIINETKCIPRIIFCLKNLETLIIENTYFCNSKQQINGKMEYLPRQIITLKKLRTLKISHVNLISLPNIIWNLSSLTDLSISHAKLISLPNIIGNRSSLQRLSIYNTNLRSLPKTISNLKFLERIILKNNPHLRSIKTIDGLPALETLDIRHCSVEDLPRNLPKLVDLYMPYNNLTRLNPDIGTLSNKGSILQNFEFNNNRIRLISSEIRKIHTLSRLHLDHNQLDNLPTDMSDMISLTHLFLRNNSFSQNEKQRYIDEFKKNSKLKVYF